MIWAAQAKFSVLALLAPFQSQFRTQTQTNTGASALFER